MVATDVVPSLYIHRPRIYRLPSFDSTLVREFHQSMAE